MDTSDLIQKKCQPCEGKASAFDTNKAAQYLPAIIGWQLREDGKTIYRDFQMKNFLDAVDLINDIAELAEAENHHPDLHLTGYRKLCVELSTHAIKGLSENDFILAAKINKLLP
ncbi:MAG: 4a-hydroxytetrahydrobiopterin dehydratase [Candidatus Omnitrophota bacterium]